MHKLVSNGPSLHFANLKQRSCCFRYASYFSTCGEARLSAVNQSHCHILCQRYTTNSIQLAMKRCMVFRKVTLTTWGFISATVQLIMMPSTCWQHKCLLKKKHRIWWWLRTTNRTQKVHLVLFIFRNLYVLVNPRELTFHQKHDNVRAKGKHY